MSAKFTERHTVTATHPNASNNQIFMMHTYDTITLDEKKKMIQEMGYQNIKVETKKI